MDERKVMPSFTNRILSALPPSELKVVRPALSPVRLITGQVLYEAGEKISLVFFLEQGIASAVARTHGQLARVEVGLAGPESVVGCVASLGPDAVSFNSVVVQSAGAGYRMSSGSLRDLVGRLPRFRTLISERLELQIAQLSQAAACNAQHSLAERMARWLLMVHDRTEGDALAFTHEYLAITMAVRRAGVTIALHSLESAGLIAHSRARIVINDRAGLESAACSCYARFIKFGDTVTSRSVAVGRLHA